MTCCVAALCDDRKSLVLISDRMFATWSIQSELNVDKLLTLSSYSWVLFAGDDISPVFGIIDDAKQEIQNRCRHDGITLDSSVPVTVIADSPLPDFLEIKGKISLHSLRVDFLVGGFCNGVGFIFSVTNEAGGVMVTRHDIPGFHSIGSGSIGANYMLYYRELSYKAPTRKALCYATEAKFFGEQAAGVSEGTDVYIATSEGKFLHLDEKKVVDKHIYAVVRRLRPRFLSEKTRGMLNAIPDLAGFSELTEDDE